MTVQRANQSASNEHTLAPGNPFSERTTNVYNASIAEPHVNRFGRRAGERYFEEGLASQPDVAGPFGGGASAGHGFYEVDIAGQANGRSPEAQGELKPSWDAVPREAVAGFRAGTRDNLGQASVFPFEARAGHNRQTITDLSGLALGERPNTAMIHARVTGNRVDRRNTAHASDGRP
jgi:hypothetical protein